jgi:CRISP-associated protein Cas1
MLSFVYALLVKDVSVTALAVGFDPYMGFYHQPHFGRPALALDLAEEFRPLIGDSVVIGMVNTGEVTAGDFVFRVGACALNATGRKKVMQAYERRMGSEVRHPTFGYTVSYRRTMEIQARLLGRALTGELPAYVPFRTR